MKIPITITLDIELVEQLRQEKNYSDLINEEMRLYFNQKNALNVGILNKKLDRTKQILKENRKKERFLKKQLEKAKLKEGAARRNISIRQFVEQRRARLRKLKGGDAP